MMDHHPRKLALAARVAALVILFGGGSVLCGWATDVQMLKSILPGFVSMNPATALLFIVAAVGIGGHTLPACDWRVGLLKQATGVLVLIGGGLVIVAFVFDWEWGFDRVLFSTALGTNRIAPNTAVYFILIGLAMLNLGRGRVRVWLCQCFAILVLAGAAMSLLGYGYGAKNLYGIGNFIPMALNTAVLFAVTSTALLCLQGTHGLFSVLYGSHSGSAMARQLLPIAITVPWILGFLRVLGQNAAWYDTEFGAALMVLMTVVMLVAAIIISAHALNRTDIQRRQAELAIRQLNESLEQRVEERTAELADTNFDLAHKNQENEMFVYSVSHDLRSPLVNLQGFSKELDVVAGELKQLLSVEEVPEAIRAQATALLDGDIKQSLHFIQTAVNRLGNIIDALLRLSRVGRIEYQCGPVDLQGVVTRVVESMSGALYDANAVVHFENLPPCYGDSTALEQLFANLIGNALKYRRPDVPCTIEVGVSTKESSGTRGRTRTYYVQDNGLGIPLAHQEKIFQAFKRAHPHVATGEGMGLAIVRRIVQRHGGTVSVESQEGSGSTFFICLPIHACSVASKSGFAQSLEGEPRHGSRTDGDLVSGRR